MPTTAISRTYAWYVVGVLTLANVSSFVDRQILSLLTEPIQRDLGLSFTQMGALIGVPFAIFFTIMGLPLARLADSTSRRGVIGVGIAVWSVMTAACGFAGTYGKLLLARVGVGVGEGSLQAPAISLIGDYFPPGRRATAQSVYATGIFIGSGLAYFIGGWIVGLVSAQEQWTVPIVGHIRPWQTVFMLVGLPGLLVAALMFTVREPERQDHSTGTAPLFELWRWVRANFAIVTLYTAGFTASATVNFAIAMWMNRWLTAAFGWPASKAGMVQGLLTMIVGTAAVIAGGRWSDWLSKRGQADAPLRVGIVAAAGLLVSGVAAFTSVSDTAAIVWLGMVNIFAALPWGAAQAGAAQLVPPRLKSQGVALFILFVNLISFSLGPLSVGVLTDQMFNRDVTRLGSSLSIVTVAGLAIALAFMLAARRTAVRPS
ncbi:MAG: MFS transporter [Gemmatimonadota bacterium]